MSDPQARTATLRRCRPSSVHQPSSLAPSTLTTSPKSHESSASAPPFRSTVSLVLTCGKDGFSVDLDAQIRGCVLAEGPAAVAGTEDFRPACREIEKWAERMEAMESAGVDIPGPMRRRSLLNRIDAILQSSPPHLRAHRARAAADARRVANSPHGAAVERELKSFADSRLSDDEWLSALASLDSLPRSGQSDASEGFQLRALLLFTP